MGIWLFPSTDRRVRSLHYGSSPALVVLFSCRLFIILYQCIFWSEIAKILFNGCKTTDLLHSFNRLSKKTNCFLHLIFRQTEWRNLDGRFTTDWMEEAWLSFYGILNGRTLMVVLRQVEWRKQHCRFTADWLEEPWWSFYAGLNGSRIVVLRHTEWRNLDSYFTTDWMEEAWLSFYDILNGGTLMVALRQTQWRNLMVILGQTEWRNLLRQTEWRKQDCRFTTD